MMAALYFCDAHSREWCWDDDCWPFRTTALDERGVHYRSNPETLTELAEIREVVLCALTVLPKTSQKVVRLRFGLDGGDPQTLQAVGDLLDVSPERVRQIQISALMRLRWSLVRSCTTLERAFFFPFKETT